MNNNQNNIQINFGCKKISFEKVMVIYKTTAQPCWTG